MTLRKNTLAASLGMLILVLAGCSAPHQDPASTPSPDSTPSPSSTPSSDTPDGAVEMDPADPMTWVITASGVGPIALSGDFEDTLAALPDTWRNDTENCGWSAWWNDAPNYGVYFVRNNEPTSTIQEISVNTSGASPEEGAGPVTAEGLGIGATRDSVLAAYPDAVEGSAQIGSGSWIKLAGDGAHVFFEFLEGGTLVNAVVVTTRDEPSYEVCG